MLQGLFSSCLCAGRENDAELELVIDARESLVSRRRSFEVEQALTEGTFHRLGPPSPEMIRLHKYCLDNIFIKEDEGKKVVDDHLYMLRLCRRICEYRNYGNELRNEHVTREIAQYAHYRTSKEIVSKYVRPLLNRSLRNIRPYVQKQFPSALFDEVPFKVYGRNRKGYPVLYFTVPSPKIFDIHGADVVEKFFITVLEARERILVSLRDYGELVYGNVVLIDASQLKFAHVNPFGSFKTNMVKIVKEVFQTYIGCISKVVCVNAPKIVQMVWTAATSGPAPVVTTLQQKMFTFAATPLKGLEILDVDPSQIPKELGGESVEQMISFVPWFAEDIDFDKTFPQDALTDDYPEIWEYPGNDVMAKIAAKSSTESFCTRDTSAERATSYTSGDSVSDGETIDDIEDNDVVTPSMMSRASTFMHAFINKHFIFVLLLSVMMWPNVDDTVFWIAACLGTFVFILSPRKSNGNEGDPLTVKS